MRVVQNPRHLIGKINIVLLFAVTQLVALNVVFAYPDDYKAFEGMESSPIPIAIFMAEILIFTAILIYLARKGKDSFIRGIIGFLFFFALLYVIEPLLIWVSAPFASITALTASALLTYITLRRPRWYVTDCVGILVGGGIAAMLGFSLVPRIVGTLLIVLAAYDYYSVYRSKHMLELAEVADRTNIPLLFVSPTGKKVARIRDGKKTEEHTYFLGFGDAVLPGALAVSVLTYMGDVYGALATVGGGVVGLTLLLITMEEGKGYPGLPFINGGALGALALYSVYVQFLH